MRGYGGKFVKIDLTKSKVLVEDTPMDLMKSFIGGKWLGAYILYKYLDPKISPLSPGNILFVTSGPATGTPIPMSSKISFFFKSPLTGIFGESTMGGNFPAAFKWVGLDGLMITGRSEKPVYLYITPDEIEIRDADHLWGLDTEKTEEVLISDLGREIEIAEIGPAGEKLIRFASISHGHGSRMRESKAGRVGGGAVMGSKNLKAIVLHPHEKKVDVYDVDRVKELSREFISRAVKEPSKSGIKGYREYGTPITVAIAHGDSAFPNHFWENVETPYYEDLDPDLLKEKYYKKRLSCWNCPYSCGKYSIVEEDDIFKGIEVKGPEYETIFSFGGNADLTDYKAIISLNLLCDRYGVDTIDMGNIIAFTLYAVEKGRIKLDRPVKFGDYESILYLFQLTMERRGIGDVMAEGMKIMAKRLGLEDIAIHVKGLTLAGYDPRRLKGMALSYAIGTRGGGHLRTTSYAYEFKRIIKPEDTGPEKVKFLVDIEDLFSLHDSMIFCRFARFVYDWEFTIEILNALTGFNYEYKWLKEQANYVRTIIRWFNLNAGMKPEEDTLPPRFFKEGGRKLDGTEVRITREELRSMVKEYYRLRGWDEDGYPRERIML
ncbi:aldehyde:ferredoxin oxidoreductase [Candidatus Geothermarchaeota archaeon]|nr:MAG: aldehyde:ferredoxin oxidoreductase [Candidatus Geothermarchaeota archaeon]RLG61867.1 MAG: aldehyde:ferredoxin oxidoreductase [Candidatus Geothermarchaeota archaeon]HEW93980.1 aldehyde:ferredoxin oxidoreductase [Thermoprotei archaeon]